MEVVSILLVWVLDVEIVWCRHCVVAAADAGRGDRQEMWFEGTQ